MQPVSMPRSGTSPASLDKRTWPLPVADRRYAGLTWTEHQSGAFRAQETRLIKAANAYLRYYLVQAANSVKNREPEFRAFYAKKYHEVSKHQHKRALVLTARKLVRLIYALEKEKRLYQPKSTYLQVKETQN